MLSPCQGWDRGRAHITFFFHSISFLSSLLLWAGRELQRPKPPVHVATPGTAARAGMHLDWCKETPPWHRGDAKPHCPGSAVGRLPGRGSSAPTPARYSCRGASASQGCSRYPRSQAPAPAALPCPLPSPWVQLPVLLPQAQHPKCQASSPMLGFNSF